MPRITISYRRDDSLDITGRIFEHLARHYGRDSVFRDIDNIPPGVDFRKHINSVLDESDIVLAIVGPRWIGPRANQSRLANAADPVRVEIETALRKDRPLIPVLVQRVSMPRVEQLPESMQDFAYRNAVEIDSGRDFEHHMNGLIRWMDRILKEGEGPKSTQPIALDHPTVSLASETKLRGSSAESEKEKVDELRKELDRLRRLTDEEKRYKDEQFNLAGQQIQRLTEERDAARQENDRLTTETNALREQTKQHIDNLENLTSRLTVTQQKMAVEQEKKGQAFERISELEKEIESLRARVNRDPGLKPEADLRDNLAGNQPKQIEPIGAAPMIIRPDNNDAETMANKRARSDWLEVYLPTVRFMLVLIGILLLLAVVGQLFR